MAPMCRGIGAVHPSWPELALGHLRMTGQGAAISQDAVIVCTSRCDNRGKKAMPNDFRVTLLGTGTPIPRPDRFGPSTLVEAGEQRLLIDAGRGATIRLYQLGVPIGSLDALLLTHYHSDHTNGIPDVWLTGWLKSVYARRSTPFRVI